MDKFELAEKLYKVGYAHKDVRAIWAYAWNEQHVGQSKKKKKPWELKALEEILVDFSEIKFDDWDNGDVQRCF